MSDTTFGPLRRSQPTAPVAAVHPRRPHRLAGPDSWGMMRVGYARHWAQYRLIIYPPGIPYEQRLRLRIWYAAPIWGSAVGLVLWTVLAGAGVGVVWSISVPALITAAAVVWSERTTHQVRRRIHHRTVWLDLTADPLTSVPRNHLLDIVDALRRNDADLRNGRINPAQHEAIWARCYDQLI
ncbi:DUF6611 family protein [Gordonia sp. LSe1-13]|uniref:DUF6611 family protein n=1 Tax=Gordonia sesuvii TaxID=3116777 RepID=A0ABU7MJM0_9ACTN|nr:DUF6611 family protein [Gordonia sp. LSe1-13]